MNFPKVHGARIVPQPDAELVAAEARLAALDEQELVAVRPGWIDETVAKVAAATPVVRAGRLRRVAAAAVAFFALHGFAAAATVTAVTAATVTAVVLWPERANSIDTLKFEDALRILATDAESEDARTAAIILVSHRVRWVIEALKAMAGDGTVAAELHSAAGSALTTLAADLGEEPVVPVRDCVDPLSGALEDLRNLSVDQETRRQALASCLEAARAGIQQVRGMPVATDSLRKSREIAMKRFVRYLRP